MGIHHHKNRCRRIALSGGPGGGKTTAAELFRCEMSDRVKIAPEAATLVFSGGFPRSEHPQAIIAAQRAIYHVQRNLEDSLALLCPEHLMLCDRGTVDGGAYWPGESEEDFFADMGSSLEQELERYAAVLFFESAAVGGHGIELGNPIRTETQNQAVKLDYRLRSLWQQHPRFILVPNQASFFQKIANGMEILKSLATELA
jgi:AAA domain